MERNFSKLILTGTLLCLLFAFKATAYADVIYVPDDYLTIQEAVDNAISGDTIVVAAGTYAGAIIDKEVHIKGSGNETIISEIPAPFGAGGPKAGFFLPGPMADNTSISHTSFAPFDPDAWPNDGVSFPVFCRDVDSVKVSHISSGRSVQGVTFTSSTNSEVGHSRFSNTTTWFGGGGGIAISISGEGGGHRLGHNYVSLSELFGVVGFSPVGIGVTAVPAGPYLGSSSDVLIRNNRVEVVSAADEGTQGIEISTHAGYLPAQGDPHTGIVVVFNDLRVGDPELAIVAREEDEVTALKNLDGSKGGRRGKGSKQLGIINHASGKTGSFN